MLKERTMEPVNFTSIRISSPLKTYETALVYLNQHCNVNSRNYSDILCSFSVIIGVQKNYLHTNVGKN